MTAQSTATQAELNARADVSAELLQEHLNVFSTLFRDSGSEDERKAAKYIADKLTEELKDAHPYVIAGYSADETHARNQTLTGQYAAVGVYSADRLLRKGINAAAVAAGRGAEVPDRVEVRVVMHESNRDAALPKAAVKEEEAEPIGPNSAPENAKAKTKATIELKD